MDSDLDFMQIYQGALNSGTPPPGVQDLVTAVGELAITEQSCLATTRSVTPESLQTTVNPAASVWV